MSLFEKPKETHHFPTEPAFVVPVTIRDAPQYGKDHKGVFAAAPIPVETKFWVWTDRVIQIHQGDLENYIKENFSTDAEVATFLRQGFVLPDKSDYFNSNPTDAGRFMNHSHEANCGPNGALRDIQEGEEMTMDYSFHGNPEWYQCICKKYGVKTEAEVAKEHGDKLKIES
mmetsp:Transcript_12493/g.15669  ORF Transcript_12493/g.15669 Transcript_12493/m.15669 type:complete len:171 (+) Transcript_12493:121-633(+)|eukprot:CAMPEP_0172501746 /NCGR_PEP_ID=MMETSP1066-20121228/153031_1 /TAXON_ID=671091 /ORGANISM="Coscinodiscus wailesii, Strain CCMP2513" /LENGTH=170 /DNA_ID=CAMNT_0013276709 /DNA_START=99 /DNA_END=611 /DNA_ORIENTATION=-